MGRGSLGGLVGDGNLPSQNPASCIYKWNALVKFSSAVGCMFYYREVLILTVLKMNLEALEAMDFFWAALKDRERISDLFIQEVTAMQGYELSYDEEFTSESVRRVLSALANREPFKASNKKEGRLYSNHLWMMDDLGIEKAMLQPVKQLNVEHLRQQISTAVPHEEIQIHVVPLHLDTHKVVKNHLLINFVKIQLGEEENKVNIQNLALDDFILNTINQEMI